MRDSEGWIVAGKNLNITNGFYTLTGLCIDLKANRFYLLTDKSKYNQRLLTHEDVALVLANSGDRKDEFPGSFFSLDPIDENLTVHPFQRFRYSPSCLKGSQMLSTLFNTVNCFF